MRYAASVGAESSLKSIVAPLSDDRAVGASLRKLLDVYLPD